MKRENNRSQRENALWCVGAAYDKENEMMKKNDELLIEVARAGTDIMFDLYRQDFDEDWEQTQAVYPK